MHHHLVCLFALLSFSAGAATLQLNQSQGRFQIIQVSDMRADQYLLDSQTGRVWRMVCGSYEAATTNSDGAATERKCAGHMWQEEHVEHLPASKAKAP